jgi:uncharacterized protein (DUF58 family)
VRPALTARGIGVLAGAVLADAASWIFGTRELTVIALALLLAPLAALALVTVARRTPTELTRHLPARSFAGAPLAVFVELAPVPSLVSLSLVERCAGLGDPVALLERRDGRLAGDWRVDRVRRGRYALAPELVLEDPFGLVRARLPLVRPGLVRVEPELATLDTPHGSPVAGRGDARRARVASAGEELAGVRDHEVGESLRRVHWGTSARRGRLTVRELEERARGELAILLDGAAGGSGEAFERAVQVAGSLALHALRAGIVVSFTCTGRVPVRIDVRASGLTPELVDALCSVEADGARPLAGLLPAGPGTLLCVVTCDASPELAARVRALRDRRRAVSLVVVRPEDDLAVHLAALTRAGVAGAA